MAIEYMLNIPSDNIGPGDRAMHNFSEHRSLIESIYHLVLFFILI